MKLYELYEILCAVMPEHDARYVLAKRGNVSRTQIISSVNMEISEVITQCVNQDLQRFRNGEPLSRIYAEREFWGLNFTLSPDTLDPRHDTETLIDAVIARFKHHQPRTILDLGTGTGCILIALLKEFPDAQGVGVDIAADALSTAHKNAQLNGVDARAKFIQSHWFENVEGEFDLITSNPPYIASHVILELSESVRKFDPILALDGGEDGLQAYKEIFSKISSYMNKGARAYFEIGFDQEKSATRLLTESRLLLESTYADLAGHIRVLEVSCDDAHGDKK